MARSAPVPKVGGEVLFHLATAHRFWDVLRTHCDEADYATGHPFTSTATATVPVRLRGLSASDRRMITHVAALWGGEFQCQRGAKRGLLTGCNLGIDYYVWQLYRIQD